jgi:hypothetical protein
VARGGGGAAAPHGALAIAVNTTRSGSPKVSGELPRERGWQRSFRPLKWVSLAHSCIYLSLLSAAFLAGKPEPLTFALGLAHGLLWILMSLSCIAAARLGVVSVRLAVAVAVLGGIGPFFGSYEFLREQQHRKQSPSNAVGGV